MNPPQYTPDQVAAKLKDMQKRRVWGRLIVHLQDGRVVRLVREESDRPGFQDEAHVML